MREATCLSVALVMSFKPIFSIGKKKILTSVNISVLRKKCWVVLGSGNRPEVQVHHGWKSSSGGTSGGTAAGERRIIPKALGPCI